MLQVDINQGRAISSLLAQICMNTGLRHKLNTIREKPKPLLLLQRNLLHHSLSLLHHGRMLMFSLSIERLTIRAQSIILREDRICLPTSCDPPDPGEYNRGAYNKHAPIHIVDRRASDGDIQRRDIHHNCEYRPRYTDDVDG